MKIAVVVQRYGADINGGAELHARYIAEHLSRHTRVEVLTTCARDYVTWRNELEPGIETVNGVQVRRFAVSQEREPEDFGRRSQAVFERQHSVHDELRWLESEGPTAPALIAHIGRTRHEFDFYIFFSYRYYHAYHGIREVADRAVLVPTAERDPAVALSIFQPVFRGVRAVMYNSFEERALIQAVSNNIDVPGVIVGVGSDIPPEPSPERARKNFGLTDPFAIYVGRIDENKGCPELFSHFQRYAIEHRRRKLSLVLAGNSILPIPDNPRIRHVGFVTDRDKFDLMAAARVLVMPSYFESLSMVALEAWALGRPVLANGRCDVLRGQCIRSNAGLYYDNYEEFAEALRLIDTNNELNEALGRNGSEYFERHYSWPVIERKYMDMLEQLRHDDRPRNGIEPLPGWFSRRRRTVPSSGEVLARVGEGPVIPARRKPARPQGPRGRRASGR